jgi:hypothetical protein
MVIRIKKCSVPLHTGEIIIAADSNIFLIHVKLLVQNFHQQMNRKINVAYSYEVELYAIPCF